MIVQNKKCHFFKITKTPVRQNYKDHVLKITLKSHKDKSVITRLMLEFL